MYSYIFDALRQYLRGDLTQRELDLQVGSFDWNDTAAEAIALRPTIGKLELILEEVQEGFRDEDELRQLARAVLQASMPSRT